MYSAKLWDYMSMRKGKSYRLYNVGISRDDIPAIPHILITAGGSHNGEAILAVARAGIRGVLITDEGQKNIPTSFR